DMEHGVLLFSSVALVSGQPAAAAGLVTVGSLARIALLRRRLRGGGPRRVRDAPWSTEDYEIMPRRLPRVSRIGSRRGAGGEGLPRGISGQVGALAMGLRALCVGGLLRRRMVLVGLLR